LAAGTRWSTLRRAARHQGILYWPYLAITSGPSNPAKAKLVNTPELKEQRNATVLYVFTL
jgi:hypothetical protein